METKKLTQEELDQIKTIQTKSEAITVELGQIELVKIALEARAVNAKTFLGELRQEEKTLAEALEATYGKGSIDLEKGEFMPLEEEAQVPE